MVRNAFEHEDFEALLKSKLVTLVGVWVDV